LFFLKEIVKRVSGAESEWESHLNNIIDSFEDGRIIIEPCNLLDVGCGSGNRSIKIAEYFNVDMKNLFGVDFSNQLLCSTNKQFNVAQVDLESGYLPYKENTFDLVMCNQVLEHLKYYLKVINEIIRVTRINGFIVLGIPNLAHLINRIYLLCGIQPMCIGLNSSHVRGFTHNSFLKLLEELKNVQVIKYTGSNLMYPLPVFMAKFLSKHFIGLSAYTCYVIQKVS